jgi:nitroreductase
MNDNPDVSTGPEQNALASFIDLVRTRRSTRHFRPDPVPRELLDELLEAARWAPSGFNLQPTHFVVVTDAAVKDKLYTACMKQRQVVEAGATVVFTGDRRVVPNHFERVMKQDREAGAINEVYEQLLRRAVPLSFNQGPLGFGWLWKAVGEAVAGRFVPIPSIQAVHKSYWLAKQVCLSAMVFMLAAQRPPRAGNPLQPQRGARGPGRLRRQQTDEENAASAGRQGAPGWVVKCRRRTT